VELLDSQPIVGFAYHALCLLFVGLAAWHALPGGPTCRGAPRLRIGGGFMRRSARCSSWPMSVSPGQRVPGREADEQQTQRVVRKAHNGLAVEEAPHPEGHETEPGKAPPHDGLNASSNVAAARSRTAPGGRG